VEGLDAGGDFAGVVLADEEQSVADAAAEGLFDEVVAFDGDFFFLSARSAGGAELFDAGVLVAGDEVDGHTESLRFGAAP